MTAELLRKAATLMRERSETESVLRDPAVLLAVADWLDTAGADLWAGGPLCSCGSACLECDDDGWQPHVRRALVVARAYIGEDA